MRVFLVDGTYELFRHFFAVPSHRNSAGREVAASRAVASSLLAMLESGVTHLGVATDHVIESFRNELWPGYKTSAGVPPSLLEQFTLLEEVLEALGITVWPMTELEADDALASVAASAGADPRVTQVLICSPDKDLAQCVVGERVVQMDRMRNLVTGEDGVLHKFGVRPGSIPDYLALVGDAADGFGGLPGWGARSAATVLARWGSIEAIPPQPADWEVTVRGATRLAETLVRERETALLFKDLATLRTEPVLIGSVEALRWSAPRWDLAQACGLLDAAGLAERALRLAATRETLGGGRA